MTAVSGIRAGDPQAAYREEACRFLDERLSNAQKLDFIHQILRRDAAEARMFLDRIEGFLSSFNEDERREPPASNALDAIARDQVTRDRFLQFARDADQASVRARMTSVARDLGWLSPADYRAELMSMIRELMARPSVTTAEVDLICSLNDGHDLDRELDALEPSLRATNRTDHAAALACLGSSEHHDRMLLALSSPDDNDVRMAECISAIDRSPTSPSFASPPPRCPDERIRCSGPRHRHPGATAPVRSPEPGRGHAFVPVAASLNVQRAIAGLIIRSDYRANATPETIRMLRESRLKSSSGEDIIDILIRRLEAS
jgi:hypothetical protein